MWSAAELEAMSPMKNSLNESQSSKSKISNFGNKLSNEKPKEIIGSEDIVP